MTREELEKAMGNEPKIQASFEVIGDDAKFIKLIVNGKEKVVSVEELENTPSETYRETDDYENEIADLHNRLDIAEYDKERLREEVTVLEEKLKALYTEPCDCISRAELLKAVDTWDKFGCDADTKLVPVKDCYVPYIHYDDVVKAIKGMPSIQPTTKENLVVEDCISRQATVERLCKVAEFMNEKRNGLGSPYVMAALFIQDNKDEFPPVTPKPKTDVLDKIRAEIHATAEMHEDGDYYLRDEWIDEIIDKYKAEKE